MTTPPIPRRGLWPHLASVFAGAGIDNVFRMAAMVLFQAHATASHPGDRLAADHAASLMNDLSALVFLAPFVLLAPLAGDLGDRLPKHLIMRGARLADLGILAIGALGVWTGSLPLIWLTLALLGCASAFFGTVKLSAMPELVPSSRLAMANGLLAASTLVAILVGKGLGSLADAQTLARIPGLQETVPAWLATPVGVVLAAGGALAALGLAGAFLGPRLVAADPAKTHRPLDYAGQLRVLWRTPGLTVPALSLAGFWGLAVVAEVLLVTVAGNAFPEFHPWGMPGPVCLVVVLTLGIVAGSLLAPLLAAPAFPAGLPLAGATVAGLGLVMAGREAHAALSLHAASGAWGFAGWLFAAGIGAGLWDVPMQVLLQERAPAAARNQVMAAVGVLTSVGMLACIGIALALGAMSLSSGQVYIVTGGVCLALAAGGAWLYRIQVAGWLASLLTRLLWKVRVEGAQHLPAQGGCLVVCNHLSLADGLILGACLPRRARFLIWHKFVSMPVVGLFLRAIGSIPVPGEDARRSLIAAIDTAIEAARAGEVVVIFPEGKLTRSGQMDAFKGGMERIAGRAGVPVVPAHLDGLWGSFLSRHPRRSWPRFRHRVDLRLGAPMPPVTTAEQARVAVTRLAWEQAESVTARDHRTLGGAALAQARRRPFALAVRDAQGSLSGWQLAGAAQALARRLDDGGRGTIGLILPPGRAGAIANLAVALLGRTAVNLNHTVGAKQLQRMCELAGISTVVSAAPYLKRIGQPQVPCRMVLIEDELRAIGKLGVVRGALRALLLPGAARGRPGDIATVVFSSGSTGDPKGVQLTHRQVLANIRCTVVALEINHDDGLLTPLPLFHSFGLVPGMWLGLVTGLRLACHPDPTDAKALGELAASTSATWLISAPTFVRGYLRRIPPEQFRTLRFAVVGAERCPADLRQQFKATYGCELLEGYGCTELAPVVAVNLLPVRRDGLVEVRSRDGTVGRGLPGVQVVAVDPESKAELPPGSEGLLVVRSPSRMQGYLGRDDLTTAAFIAGGYSTGDMGKVDGEGFVTITGRMARFAKIGGEMVPLDSIEAALQAAAGDAGEIAVAAVPDPAKGERLVVLHAGQRPEAAAVARALEPLPALWRPKDRDWHAVEALPKLGTGKRDLAGVKAMALAKAG